MTTTLSPSSPLSIPVKKLTVKKIINDEDIKQLTGEHLTLKPDTTILQSDCSVYKEDGTPLLHFRKNVIPKELSDLAFKNLKKAGKVPNNNRGTAAGKFNVEQFVKERPKVKPEDLKIQSGGGYMAYYGKTKVANTANSGLIGYMDRENRMNRAEGKCRLTSFSAKNMEKYNETMPFFQCIDEFFKTLEPERHQKQHLRAGMTRAQIADTCFTTISVNYNFRTALHTDSGDYQPGFGCFSVAENTENKTSFEGCELMFPQYNVAVNVRHGDILLFDAHVWHCNNTAVFGKEQERLSFVCYLRTEMLAACSNRPDHPVQQFKKFKMTFRPNTMDEKLFEEAMTYKTKECVVEEGDVVLDLGAHIGSFSMWALSLGANRVVSVEPNPDHVKYLKENAYLNTWEEKVKIVEKFVTGVPSEEKNFVTFTDLLGEDITMVKMNIEGAEHEILDYCKDWKNVRKLICKYYFDKHLDSPYNTWAKFVAIMDQLKAYRFDVKYKNVSKDLPDHVMVYGVRNVNK
jgi:hypothetical protein